jgi:hypothetical protein
MLHRVEQGGNARGFPPALLPTTEGPSLIGAGPLSRRAFTASTTIIAVEHPDVPSTDPRGLSEPPGDRDLSLLRSGS